MSVLEEMGAGPTCATGEEYLRKKNSKLEIEIDRLTAQIKTLEAENSKLKRDLSQCYDIMAEIAAYDSDAHL